MFSTFLRKLPSHFRSDVEMTLASYLRFKGERDPLILSMCFYLRSLYDILNNDSEVFFVDHVCSLKLHANPLPQNG